MEARQPACFKACPDPDDHTSDCWIECLFETIVGNSTKVPALPATPKDVIVRMRRGKGGRRGEGGERGVNGGRGSEGGGEKRGELVCRCVCVCSKK